MNTRYYYDPPIGYMVVWGPGSGVGGSDFEGRSASRAGIPESCCTGGISRKYLAACKRVAKRNVPQVWLDWLGETMAMRNWWIEATIDGRKHKLAGGPCAKCGGFRLTIHQRDNGESVKVLSVEGVVYDGGDGGLELQIDPVGHKPLEIRTQR